MKLYFFYLLQVVSCLRSCLEDIQGQFPELHTLEEAVLDINEMCKVSFPLFIFQTKVRIKKTCRHLKTWIILVLPFFGIGYYVSWVLFYQ